MSENRIYLIGMPAVGKTTLGKKLASTLHYTFIDLDKLIEQKTQQTIAEIFQKGENYFREVEKQVLYETSQMNNCVIATGGGAPCFHSNMNWMNAHGKTIYLKVNVAFLVQRLLQGINERPLFRNVSEEELPAFITQLLNEREAFYMQAKVVAELPLKKLTNL